MTTKVVQVYQLKVTADVDDEMFDIGYVADRLRGALRGAELVLQDEIERQLVVDYDVEADVKVEVVT